MGQGRGEQVQARCNDRYSQCCVAGCEARCSGLDNKNPFHEEELTHLVGECPITLPCHPCCLPAHLPLSLPSCLPACQSYHVPLSCGLPLPMSCVGCKS